MPAVVREENHDRVLGQLQPLQGCLYCADTVIHTLDHCRVLGIGVPADCRFLFILRRQRLLRLNGRVYGVMRKIQEERIVLIGLNKLARLCAQTVGGILTFFRIHEIRIFVRTMIATATRTAPFAPSNVDIKPLRGRVLAQVPFAHRGRHISGLLQHLGNGLKAICQHRGVFDRDQLAELRLPAIRVADRINPMPRSVQTAHQARATGRTIRCTRVGVHKHHALLRQPVDMRRLIIFRAHERHIRPA